MTSLFFDLNIWLSLSVRSHAHHEEAWKWFHRLPVNTRLLFSRYTQIGLLRLLTNTAVMGEETRTLREAWKILDLWLEDPRVLFLPDPPGVDSIFRQATEPFAHQPASKWVGDCWLLAFAMAAHAHLVTFDRALCEFARKQGHAAVLPGRVD
jgi:hypothetical protein